MLQNFTTLFKNLSLRSGVPLCSNISVGKFCSEPPTNDDTKGDSKKVVAQSFKKRSVYPYSKEILTDKNFNTYPFYVEREWWKDGKRMTFWANWKQFADVKRRRALAECGADRMRYKALKENTILPQALRDEMAETLHNMDKYSRPNLILNLCMFTGRSRGKIKPYRVNRHIFRRLADASKLSGVQRAMW
uniref:Isocitrate dehydrogenase [NAD] subunit, mitochondrial n=1 Tax=Strongyloides stercoralis TaxID=6248 RepID=A0A0K0EL12_STRER